MCCYPTASSLSTPPPPPLQPFSRFATLPRPECRFLSIGLLIFGVWSANTPTHAHSHNHLSLLCVPSLSSQRLLLAVQLAQKDAVARSPSIAGLY
ncbi:hypothetical protein RRG08_058095 [Elysia crispata]|uniref:Uncharacterized protein n=1 Tax=Elysia crispata TaxID=231223 RepID=A0AAE1CYE6_9GAST|nr:hypothetical protein RRG08_058095 [Elysia crispata]